jgi:hypothetical protein
VCGEALVLAVAGASAMFAGKDPSSRIVYVLIVLTGIAMGLRNAVIRKLAVPDLTTTVLTLTGLAADSTLAGGTSPRWRRRVLSILARPLVPWSARRPFDGLAFASRSSWRRWW